MNCQPFVSTIVNDQAMGGGGVDEADELAPKPVVDVGRNAPLFP